MPDGPEIREQERRLAQRFFSGSARFEAEEADRLRASRRGKKGSAAQTAVERRAAGARLYVALRLLVVVFLGFGVWQGYVWWAGNRPNPHLLNTRFQMTPNGCLVEFTVTNRGRAGRIKMVPQVILPDGKVVSGRALPPEVSRFGRGETKRLSATITSFVRYAPIGCTVKMKPPPRGAD